jgi:hypothetical protein
VTLSSSHTFTEPVAAVLAAAESTPLELTQSGVCDRKTAHRLTSSRAAELFPGASDPEAAVSGLLLLLGCWEESHRISQEIPSPEGSYWHAIAHRMEPDSANAGYWFRRVGNHPIFESLRQRAAQILGNGDAAAWKLKPGWDPFLFLQWCDEARAEPRSAKERVAREIQMAEWELLFQWCATERGSTK